MKKYTLTRQPGYFETEKEFLVTNTWGAECTRAAKVCSSAATRIFGLTPGAPRCTAVFTKIPPKKCKKYYPIVRRNSLYSKQYGLAGFGGGFLGGVEEVLGEAFDKGYRYVRLEDTK